MIRRLLTTIFLCCCTGLLYGQAPCASDYIQQYMQASDPSYQLKLKGHDDRIEKYRLHPPQMQEKLMLSPMQTLSSTGCHYTRFIIPVVFHIDTSGGTVQVTDAQVEDQVSIVNEAMKNYGIQLCLAQRDPNGNAISGISRINGTSVDNRIMYQLPGLKNITYYDPARYLNIYIVPEILNANYTTSTYLGYNNMFPGQPGIDAIVLLHNRVGNAQTCNCSNLASDSRGLVLVHELGHYLGLWHTFEGGCTAGNTAQTCSSFGDRCCDTRPLDAENFTCPLPVVPTPGCSNNSYYTSSFPENRSNYMDYSGEDCLDNFTQDQLDIMYSTLTGLRATLVNAASVNQMKLSCCVRSAWFTASHYFICNGIHSDTIVFTALRSDSGTLYRWIIKDSTGNTLKYNNIDTFSQITFVADVVGLYNVTLQVIYPSNDTVELKRNLLIEKSDCGTPLPSHKSNWYFGEYAGLNFRTNGVFRDIGPKQNSWDNISTSEGSLGISNPAGYLLFYGAGAIMTPREMKLYNKFYQPFSTNPVIGDFSSTQCGIVLPSPQNGSRYYVFIASGPDAMGPPDKRGLRYSVVDTTIIDLNANPPVYCELDAPDSVDLPVRVPLMIACNSNDSAMLCGEMITAVPKCNGRDYWIITAEYNSMSQSPANSRLVIFSLDSVGGVQFVDTSLHLKRQQYTGVIKASPDGSKLAAPGNIMNFNRLTADITLRDTMTGKNIWSMSFSPDSKVLYYLTQTISNSSWAVLHQYSFEDSTDRIVDSIPHESSMGMQLGPDGKIYISRYYLSQLAVINKPDSVVSSASPNACGLSLDGPVLSENGQGGRCVQGLPNFMDALYPAQIPKQITYKRTCLEFEFSNTLCCAQNFKWYFGDGDSATGKNVSHTYDTLNYFRVVLIADGDTLIDTVRVGIDKPIIAGNTSVVCDTTHSNTYTIGNRINGFTYNWSVTNPNQIYTDAYGGAVVTWKKDTSSLKVIATSPDGCVDSNSITIIIRPPVSHYNISASQQVCIGQVPYILQGDTPVGGLGNYHYQWYKSTDASAVKTWTKLPGDTSVNYQPPALNQTTFYIREVDPGVCAATSNVVEITVPAASDNSIWRDMSDCDDVRGSTPSAYPSGGAISYTWQRSPTGSNWQNIPGENDQHLLDPVFFDTTYVRRVVHIDGCPTSYSSFVKVDPFINIISFSEDTLCPRSTLNMTGNYHCSVNQELNYRWQYKTAAMSDFSDINSPYAGQQDMSAPDWVTNCQIRRSVLSAGKVSFSNAYQVAVYGFDNYILATGSVPYYHEMCSGTTPPLLRGSIPCTYNYWLMQWQSCTDTTNNSWSNISGATGFDYQPPVLGQTRYYRRRSISNLYDTSYTKIFRMRVKTPQVLTHPSNLSLTEGGYSDMQSTYKDLTPVKWQLGTVSGSTTTWTDNNLFLVVPITPGVYPISIGPAESCMHNMKFRVVYENSCNTSAPVYSNVATLSVNSVQYNLWSRDNAGDNGTEPYWGYIWNSPDIWNTKQQDRVGTKHQNPEYRVSAPNYIHTIVRNKGTATSLNNAELYLYWTYASTGERWTRNWLCDTTNSDSVAGNWKTYQGKRYCLGNLILKHTLPTIAAGDTFRLDTAWMAPNPAVITGNSGTSADVCFLARIVTCRISKYGMTYAETSDIGWNVSYNNNIITKNYVVNDSLPGNQYVHPAGNGNPTDEAVTGKLELTAADCDYFNYGHIILHLDDVLQGIWANTSGSGYTVVDNATLRVDACGTVTLDNILYPANTNAILGVEFVLNEGVNVSETFDGYFEFDLQQYNAVGAPSAGGIHYGVPIHLEGPVLGGAPAMSNKTPESQSNAFTVYPNPFIDELKIAYHVDREASVSIELYNIYGQLVNTVVSNEQKAPGNYKLSLNTSNLANGVYFVNFVSNGITQSRKVVLMRD